MSARAHYGVRPDQCAEIFAAPLGVEESSAPRYTGPRIRIVKGDVDGPMLPRIHYLVPPYVNGSPRDRTRVLPGENHNAMAARARLT
jgi:hypothetical protein